MAKLGAGWFGAGDKSAEAQKAEGGSGSAPQVVGADSPDSSKQAEMPDLFATTPRAPSTDQPAGAPESSGPGAPSEQGAAGVANEFSLSFASKGEECSCTCACKKK